ncbi:hypothetical protein K7H91_12285 [Martelella mediterranea]|nr:hypothetical protein [Martelella mediterranea]
MTYQRPAYEQVTIAHGGSTVSLRPTLRAAATLEARYSRPTMFKALDRQNLTIISEIILSASSSGQDAAAFLSRIVGKPLSPFFDAVRGPLSELLAMFDPEPDPKAKKTNGSGKPMTLQAFYKQLFDYATGWLEWTPDAAWSATPNEINRALNTYFAKLKTLNGVADEDERQPDPEQAERNIAAGLDPEFDREGLRALKMKIASGQ